MYEVKPLRKELISGIQGLTEKQLKEHHDVLYAGYVKKINEIREKVKKVNLDEANATFSDIRELKLEETFALNGVVLHQAYFENIGVQNKPLGKILQLLNEDFGSFENWQKEFTALGIASRGWVVLAFDWNDRKLHNYLCDAHNQGGVWGASPILILDVYEHAYFLDYGTARKNYIETFMKFVDWTVVEERIKKLEVEKHRK